MSVEAIEEIRVVREGRLTAKACKTDPVCQTWSMRQWSDGTVEQFLIFGERCRWVEYKGPAASEIIWEEPTA